jgi:hypothetical protein
VTFTRVGPRILDDDNIRPALKGVRDQVATILGIDDGDARIKWQYEQELSGKRDRYLVVVKIEEAK